MRRAAATATATITITTRWHRREKQQRGPAGPGNRNRVLAAVTTPRQRCWLRVSFPLLLPLLPLGPRADKTRAARALWMGERRGTKGGGRRQRESGGGATVGGEGRQAAAAGGWPPPQVPTRQDGAAGESYLICVVGRNRMWMDARSPNQTNRCDPTHSLIHPHPTHTLTRTTDGAAGEHAHGGLKEVAVPLGQGPQPHTRPRHLRGA